MEYCVACGKPIDRYRESHHCDPKWENRVEGRRKSEELVEWRPSFASRLSYGFFLLNKAYSREF
jgi:hypothetical protein